MRFNKYLFFLLAATPILFLCNCTEPSDSVERSQVYYPTNILDFKGTPLSSDDRRSLAFSDMGAWFAYGFPSDTAFFGGFSGPFVMTHNNGVWYSKGLCQLAISNQENGRQINWKGFSVKQTSYNSHLVQVFENQELKIVQSLVFTSAQTVLISTQITNLSPSTITYCPKWGGSAILKDIHFQVDDDIVLVSSDDSDEFGIIRVDGDEITEVKVSDSSYSMVLACFELEKGQTKQLVLTQSFIADYMVGNKKPSLISPEVDCPQKVIACRVLEKQTQLAGIYQKLDSSWVDTIYKTLVAKSVLTLQNNWRVAKGQLQHAGLFPSYHYEWFHGFWAWDSWKHAAALSHYNVPLAMDQIRAMYDYQTEEGFIPDCIYRDTAIEPHNYRNTKPPLSGWAVWTVFEQNSDTAFLKEMFPKIIKQHNWWYANRDHDQDGLCEYGSTDGSLLAAKWESGMDNAVRFDRSQILKNSSGAYSLDQESVDLNAYLFAEKNYLKKMAKVLGKENLYEVFKNQTAILRQRVQHQFFDTVSGWYYDTSIDGKTFIKAMGCEGWIPLWAEIASPNQAEAIKTNMMQPDLFYTRVPFQTLSANHVDFKPDGGYWRGPNWVDQAYFGVQGLCKYGYDVEADSATYRLIHQAKGVILKGSSLRENYNPSTGAGLESENFSWTAAHYLLLLMNK